MPSSRQVLQAGIGKLFQGTCRIFNELPSMYVAATCEYGATG